MICLLKCKPGTKCYFSQELFKDIYTQELQCAMPLLFLHVRARPHALNRDERISPKKNSKTVVHYFINIHMYRIKATMRYVSFLQLLGSGLCVPFSYSDI